MPPPLLYTHIHTHSAEHSGSGALLRCVVGEMPSHQRLGSERSGRSPSTRLFTPGDHQKGGAVGTSSLERIDLELSKHNYTNS